MNTHLSITEPVTIALFEIQPPITPPDSDSGYLDGWARDHYQPGESR